MNQDRRSSFPSFLHRLFDGVGVKAETADILEFGDGTGQGMRGSRPATPSSAKRRAMTRL